MIPLAHIAGIPVEETIASLGPALLLTFGAASATLRARLRRAAHPPGKMPHAQDGAAQRAHGAPDRGEKAKYAHDVTLFYLR